MEPVVATSHVGQERGRFETWAMGIPEAVHRIDQGAGADGIDVAERAAAERWKAQTQDGADVPVRR